MIPFTTQSSALAETRLLTPKGRPFRSEWKIRGSGYCLSVIALSITCLAAKDSFEKVRIVGRVVDEHGSPVSGAKIEVFPFGGSTGSLPSAETDSDGKYTLFFAAAGEAMITASKENAGYPNALNALYGDSYQSLKQVDISGRRETLLADLKFSAPDARIDWRVREAAYDRPPKAVSYKISLTGNPRIYMLSTLPQDGHLRFVMPRSPVEIMITAAGCEDWTSRRDGQQRSGTIFPLGYNDQRTITLRCDL